MSQPFRRHPRRRPLLYAAVLVLLAACTDSGDDESRETTSTTSEAETTDVTNPPVVQDVTDSPRTSGYVGARDDITDLTCEQDGGSWRVAGTVTNPTDAPADYRIFTAFLDDEGETRGLLQTDVTAVEAGEAQHWNGGLELDADDLTCGLRVERTTPP